MMACSATGKVYHLPDPVEVINHYFELGSSYKKEGDRIVFHEKYLREAVESKPIKHNFFLDFIFYNL